MNNTAEDKNKTCILFLDESGHHGLKKINQEFPIFLLACCIFEESYYGDIFIKKVNELRLKHFKDPNIILHSRDIRKWQKQFKCLGEIKKRTDFYKDLDDLADLVAYPIATKIIYPERVNLAFEVLEDKFYRQFPNSDYLGYGLKVFP